MFNKIREKSLRLWTKEKQFHLKENYALLFEYITTDERELDYWGKIIGFVVLF